MKQYLCFLKVFFLEYNALQTQNNNKPDIHVSSIGCGMAANCTSGSNNWYGKLWYHWNNANTVADSTKTMKGSFDPLNTGVETLAGTYNAAVGNTEKIIVK